MLVLLPVIAGQRGGGFSIAESLLISAVVLIAAFLLAPRPAPPLLRVVACSGSRELFMFAIVAIALGVALGYACGRSALGLAAFLAGIVVSESVSRSKCWPTSSRSGQLRHAVLRFCRDVDRSIPTFQWPLVLGSALILKVVITRRCVAGCGVDHRSSGSNVAAVFMAQMVGPGRLRLEHGLIDIGIWHDPLGCVCSILATPTARCLTSPLVSPSTCLGVLGATGAAAAGPPPPVAPANHVVIFGGWAPRCAALLLLGSVLQRHLSSIRQLCGFARSGYRRPVRRCRLARRAGECGVPDRAYGRGYDADLLATVRR